MYLQKKSRVDPVTSTPSDSFETETIDDTVNIYKLPVEKKNLHYWTLREII